MIKILLILLLFISENTVLTFFPDNFLFHIHPVFFICVFFCIILCRSKWFGLEYKNIPIITILALLILALFNKRTGREIDFLMFYNSLMMPIFIILIFRVPSFFYAFNYRMKLKNIVNAFLIINSAWAIFERIMLINIIPFYQGSSVWTGADNMFRSSALWGAGLANSLVVTIILCFTLFDDEQSLKKRLCLYLFGMASMICFNSRFFIIWNIIIFVTFVVHTIFFNKKNIIKSKFLFASLLLLICFLGYFALFKWNLSGRLMTMGIMDDTGSTEARLRIFDIFNLYSFNDFLFGIPADKVALVYHKVGLNIINENPWIIFLMRFGLVFEIILAFLYILTYRMCFERYKKFFAMVIALSFIICISTFNSIASNNSFISVFTLLIFIYQPVLKSKMIKLKKIKE